MPALFRQHRVSAGSPEKTHLCDEVCREDWQLLRLQSPHSPQAGGPERPVVDFQVGARSPESREHQQCEPWFQGRQSLMRRLPDPAGGGTHPPLPPCSLQSSAKEVTPTHPGEGQMLSSAHPLNADLIWKHPQRPTQKKLGPGHSVSQSS